MSRKVTKKKKREKKNLRRSGFALFEFCKVDGVGVPVGKRFRQEQFWGKINIGAEIAPATRKDGVEI